MCLCGYLRLFHFCAKKDHPFLSGLFVIFLQKEGLEYEYELSACLFFRVFCVAVFGIRAEGLHNLEHSILSEGVVSADTPGFDVIHVVAPSPTIRGAADESTIFSIDVFNPSIPRFRCSETSFAISQFANPNICTIILTIGSCDIFFIAYTFIVSKSVPFTEVSTYICTPEVISQAATSSFVCTEIVVVNANCRTCYTAAAEEAFQFAIASLGTFNSIRNIFSRNACAFYECTIVNTSNIAFFEFTIASSNSKFIIAIFQLRAIECITIIVAISTIATEDIIITANFQIPVIAAEVVINIGTIDVDISIFLLRSVTSRTIVSKVMIVSAYTKFNFCAIIDLRISANANTVIPRVIIFCGTILVTITDTSITSEFYVTNAVFQSAYANAEVVEFISIFVSEFVDEGALFDRSFVHVSHSFCDHFSSFVTSDVTVALEVLAVDTLDDAGVSQFYDGFVSPAVRRYVNERVSCECASCANSHSCCESC